MSTEKEKHELEIYGRILTGTESELDLAKLARVAYLKTKMRPRLSALIGDIPDNVTDVVRAIVLGEAIRHGIETNVEIIDGYYEYVAAMYAGYGGGAAMLSVLAGNMEPLQKELVDGYYQAKQAIWAIDDIEDINRIDLPGEPEM